MTTQEPGKSHLGPEDVDGFLERALPKERLREVEEHLDDCEECVSTLAIVMRASRPASADEEQVLDTLGGSGSETYQRLHERIAATTPSALRAHGVRWEWRTIVPIGAGVAAAALLLVVVQTRILAPARGERLAVQAMRDLVDLRQGTGRIPLRYIPAFERARVTRSGFDEADPAESHIEARLRRAVELAPEDPGTRASLGLFLLDQGNLEEAERELEAALELDPDSVLAKNGLAVLWFERSLRQPERADELRRRGLSLLTEARRAAPEDPQVAFNLGIYYQEMGRRDLARHAWAAYLRRESGTEWAEVALENLEALSRR